MYCNYCGKVIQDDAAHCAYCGKRIGSAVSGKRLVRPRGNRKIAGVFKAHRTVQEEICKTPGSSEVGSPHSR